MIFNLLENPEEADDKIPAVHDQADSDQADQGELLLTYVFSDKAVEVLG